MAYTREQILAMNPNAHFGPRYGPKVWNEQLSQWQDQSPFYNVGDWIDLSTPEMGGQTGLWQRAENHADDPGNLILAGLAAGVGGLGLSGAGLGSAGLGASDLGAFYGGIGEGPAAAGAAGLRGGSGMLDWINPNFMGAGVDPVSAANTASEAFDAPFLGAGVDPVVAADAAAGTPMFGSGSTGWLGNIFSPSNAGSLVKSLLGGGNMSGLGAVLGALAGGLGANSKPAGTTTTVQDLPEWLKPYALASLTGGANVLQQGTSTPLIDPAQTELAKTISGAYLNPSSNPYLQSTYDQAAKAVTDSYLSTTQPRTDALFNGAGAFGPGNSAYAETVARNQFGLGQNLQNLATNIFGGNYNTERGRQFGAATAAPDFTSSSYQARFSPFSSFANLIPGNIRSTSSPYFTNPMGGALSGALGGYALGRAFT